MTYTDEFQTAWSIYPRRDGNNSKIAAMKCWAARVKAGINPLTLRSAVEGYAAYVRRQGKEGTPFVMQGSRFFGVNEEYTAFIIAPKEAQKAKPKPFVQAAALEDRIDGKAYIDQLWAGLVKRKTMPGCDVARAR